MNSHANILILGKTGAGKSSLINYLFGKCIRKVGFGAPVTKETLYKCETFTHKGFELNFYDTKGIENTDTDNWLNNIEAELRYYEECCDVAGWFHVVFYCVSAATSRIESFEIKLINNILIPIVGKVHIVITQSDSISSEQLKQFESTIKEKFRHDNNCNGPFVFKTCSVEKVKRNGEKLKPYGKDELINSVFRMFWEKVTRKLPITIISQYEKILNYYSCKMYCELSDILKTTHFYNLKAKRKQLSKIIEKKSNHIELLIKIKNQDQVTKEILIHAKNIYEGIYTVLFNERRLINIISIDGVFDFIELSKLDIFGNMRELEETVMFPMKTKEFKRQLLINIQYIGNRMDLIILKYKKNGEKEKSLRKILDTAVLSH